MEDVPRKRCKQTLLVIKRTDVIRMKICMIILSFNNVTGELSCFETVMKRKDKKRGGWYTDFSPLPPVMSFMPTRVRC